MGTNYYLHSAPCHHCGRSDEPLHIGKSSAGWCFGLHVTDSIRSLDDWAKEWNKAGRTIKDEYGRPISREEMRRIICRAGLDRPLPDKWTPADYAANSAMRGPKGLVRHIVDGRHCVGHGSGAWDLIEGEFS